MIGYPAGRLHAPLLGADNSKDDSRLAQRDTRCDPPTLALAFQPLSWQHSSILLWLSTWCSGGLDTGVAAVDVYRLLMSVTVIAALFIGRRREAEERKQKPTGRAASGIRSTCLVRGDPRCMTRFELDRAGREW